MIIKKATLSDLDQIISLIIKNQKSVVDVTKLKAYLVENISKHITDLFIAIDEQTQQVTGMIQSFTSYSTVGRSEYRIISEIYFDPQASQSTIIKTLLNALESIAIQHNNSHFDIQVNLNNKVLQQSLLDNHFYKDDGYLTFVKDLTTPNNAKLNLATSDLNVEYSLRKAVASDINGLIKLIASYLEFYQINFDEHKDISFLKTNLTENRSDIFIALDGNNHILGFTQLYRVRSQEYLGDYYILFDLFVISNARRKGVAAKLLEFATQFAYQQGAKFIELQTAVTNKEAQQLYRRNGFEEKQIISFVKNLPKNVVNSIAQCNSLLVLDATQSQQQIWHDMTTTPNTLKYNMSWCWKLTGHVNVDELAKAWNKLVSIFPSLHTYFKYQDNKLYQIIDPTITPQCDIKEVGEINDVQVIQLIKNYTHHHFNLRQSPLCIAYLLIAKNNNFYLGFTFHHMVLDGHSIPMLMKQFCEFYKNPLAISDPLTLSHNSLLNRFLMEEKQRMTSSLHTDAKIFWQNYLKNVPTKIKFAVTSQAIKITPPKRNYSFSLSAEIKNQINTFITKNNITIFIFMSMLFSILLSQYSQQQKFTIGYPFGRRTKEFTNLVGYHVNLLPLAIDFSANNSVYSLQETIKQHRMLIKKNGFDYYPYVELVKDFKILPLNNSALFNVIISPTRFAQLSISGIQINELSLDSAENLTDLMLFYDEHQNHSIECGFEFNTQFFAEETILKLIEDFKLLIPQMINHPDKSFDLLLPRKPVSDHTYFTNP